MGADVRPLRPAYPDDHDHPELRDVVKLRRWADDIEGVDDNAPTIGGTPSDDRMIGRGVVDELNSNCYAAGGEERAEYPRSAHCTAVIGDCIHEVMDKLLIAACGSRGRRSRFADVIDMIRRRIYADVPRQMVRLCECRCGDEITSDDARVKFAGEPGSPKREACKKRYQRLRKREVEEQRREEVDGQKVIERALALVGENLDFITDDQIVRFRAVLPRTSAEHWADQLTQIGEWIGWPVEHTSVRGRPR
jgi:hypothetical protein